MLRREICAAERYEIEGNLVDGMMQCTRRYLLTASACGYVTEDGENKGRSEAVNSYFIVTEEGGGCMLICGGGCSAVAGEENET